MSRMLHCLGCGTHIPELIVDDDNKFNFRCTKCTCETRPQETFEEAERLWNEGRTYPHDNDRFWEVMDEKLSKHWQRKEVCCNG